MYEVGPTPKATPKPLEFAPVPAAAPVPQVVVPQVIAPQVIVAPPGYQ
jgi:hypothetical protein